MSVKIAQNLSHRGFDVATTLEEKNLGASDEAQLAYAAKTRRVLATHNLKHFLDLHTKYLSTGQTHSGIVLIVRHKDPHHIVRKLLHLIQNTPPEQMKDQIRYL